MTADDELDGELRRLFGDARLDLMPREGAEEAVVAGARRIKRRRTTLAATGGALAVVALVAGGLVLGGLRTGTNQVAAPPPTEPALTGSPTSSPVQSALDSPEATISTETGSPISSASAATASGASRMSSTPARSSSVPVSTVPVLGPSGYGKLKLGMSYEQAKATGVLLDPATAPTTKCETYSLVEGVDAISGVVISQTDGIVSFQGEAVRTPEGIVMGSSTLTQLRASYRDLAEDKANWWTASAGSGATYSFFVADDQTVTKVMLSTAASDNCGS